MRAAASDRIDGRKAILPLDKRPSIRDLYRQRSSFAAPSSPPPAPKQLDSVLNRLAVKSTAAPDSPTASATTGSPNSHGSPYGVCGGYSPISYHTTTTLSSAGMRSPSSKCVSPMTPGAFAANANASSSPVGRGSPPMLTPGYDSEVSRDSPGYVNQRYLRDGGGRHGGPDDAHSDASASSSMIDHTALLLGLQKEFRNEHEESESDDEREWNACFSPNVSLDELDRKQQGVEEEEVDPVFCGMGGAADDEEIGGHCEKTDLEDGGEVFEDVPLSPLQQGSVTALTGAEDVHRAEDNSQADDGRSKAEDDASEGSQNEEGLQLDFPCVKDDSAFNQTEQQPVECNGNYFGENEPSQAWATDDDSEDGSDSDYINVSRIIGPQKYASSLEEKRQVAKMKALAMKERAGSAFAAKAALVSNKLKGGRQQSSSVHESHSPSQPKPNGLDVTTAKDGNLSAELLSQVWELTRYDASSAPTSAVSKKKHFKSKKLSIRTKKLHQGSNTSHHSDKTAKSKGNNKSIQTYTTKMSAISSMKDKASSAMSAKAHRARDKTVGLVAGSSLIKHKRNGSLMHKTRSELSSAVLPSQEGQFLFSIEGGDKDAGILDGASMTSNNSTAHSDVFSPSAGFNVNNVMYVTPKPPPRKGLQVIGGTPERCQDGSTMQQQRIIASPPPPPISACTSNVSSRTGHGREKSCIDEDGFLLGQVGVGPCSPTLSTAGSDGTFDPNSFLFLSPLSNTDHDDPDYGMPDLLSKSMSRNAVALDEKAVCPVESTAKAPSSYKSLPFGKQSNLPRLPKSPRKKLMKKMKPPLAPRLTTRSEF